MPNVEGVCFVEIATGKRSDMAIARHPQAVDTIKSWAIANDYAAAIWTALESNFHQPNKANEPFSVDAAIRYLDRLKKLKFAKALHYVWNAPPEIQTPVRTAVDLHWPER